MSNRKSIELSQFASNIYVDENVSSIGITTDESYNVGLGTTSPNYKLHVFGDTNIVGVLTATKFVNQSGEELVNATLNRWGAIDNNIFRLTGNVGIGSSANLTEKFQVFGTSKFYDNLNVIGLVTATQFICGIETGTSPFDIVSTTQVNNLNSEYLGGKGAPTSGEIVGTNSIDYLLNKTFNDSTTLISSGVNSTRQFKFNVENISDSTVRTLDIPNLSGTVIVTGVVGIITTGMIGENQITDDKIDTVEYSTLNVVGSIQNSDLVNATISGVSLGSTLFSLIAGPYINFNSGSTYNGSSEITISLAATSTNTGNNIVARDFNGNFAGETITATHFDSISDKTYKKNIVSIDNALNTITSLNGVRFNWRANDALDYGVIAQEVETVEPILVSTSPNKVKTVNYISMIPLLIESIKELNNKIENINN